MHNLTECVFYNKGLLTGRIWPVLVAEMATVTDLRKELLSLRESRPAFAKRCGMTLTRFDAMLASGGDLSEQVESKLRELRESRSAEEAPAKTEAELGRHGINPYVREIWLPGRVQGSLQVGPEFEGSVGLKVQVKQVDGEAPWVYEFDGSYDRKGRRLGE